MSTIWATEFPPSNALGAHREREIERDGEGRDHGVVVGATEEDRRTLQEGGLRHPILPLQEQLRLQEVTYRFLSSFISFTP